MLDDIEIELNNSLNEADYDHGSDYKLPEYGGSSKDLIFKKLD